MLFSNSYQFKRSTMTDNKMKNAFSYYCQGESHKATNKVCQDYSFTSSDDDLTIAIVSDGHGGERYFRSNLGSEYATVATFEAVTYFIKHIGDSLFVGKPFTAVGPTNAIHDGQHLSKEDSALRQLFSSIIYRWNEKIKQHAKTHELTDWEKENVPLTYLEEFEKTDTFEKHYGCTLMVYAQTKTYWFAFQIGDGKCISFQKEPIWSEPIPWDDNCFLNKTTSLCDSSAIEEFRYCYQGDGNFPMAVVLGSDGLDDSFGETSNLANFYIQILKMLAKEGIDATEKSLKETLPKLSEIGSKDDMSVACVFNLKEVNENIQQFIRYQLDMIKDKLNTIEQRIVKLEIKRESLITFKDRTTQIEYNYALQDLRKAISERQSLAHKYNLIAEELPKDLVTPYTIEDDNSIAFDNPNSPNNSNVDRIDEKKDYDEVQDLSDFKDKKTKEIIEETDEESGMTEITPNS